MTVLPQAVIVSDGGETECEWGTNSTTEDDEERNWYILSKYWMLNGGGTVEL